MQQVAGDIPASKAGDRQILYPMRTEAEVGVSSSSQINRPLRVYPSRFERYQNMLELGPVRDQYLMPPIWKEAKASLWRPINLFEERSSRFA
jgi:hypothetical protein